MLPLACLLAALGQYPACQTVQPRGYAQAAVGTYQNNYVAPTTAIVAVPVALVGVKYWYSTGDGVAQAELSKRIDAQVTARLAQLVVKPMPPAAPPRLQPASAASLFGGEMPAGNAVPMPPPAGIPGAGNPADAAVLAIFGNRCASCHDAGSIKKGFQLYDASGALHAAAGYAEEVKQRGRILAAVEHLPGVAAMPKNATVLPPAEVETIRRWVLSGVIGGK